MRCKNIASALAYREIGGPFIAAFSVEWNADTSDDDPWQSAHLRISQAYPSCVRQAVCEIIQQLWDEVQQHDDAFELEGDMVATHLETPVEGTLWQGPDREFGRIAEGRHEDDARDVDAIMAALHASCVGQRLRMRIAIILLV